MLVKFQSFPQVGRGENNNKNHVKPPSKLPTKNTSQNHMKTTCSRWSVVVSNASNLKISIPKLTTTFSSTSPIRVPWSHLRCTWQVFPTDFQLQKHQKKQENTHQFFFWLFFFSEGNTLDSYCSDQKGSHWSLVTHLLYKDKWRLSKRQIRFLKFASDMWYVGMPWYFNNFQWSYDFPCFWDLKRMDSSVFLTPLTVVPSIEVYHDNTVHM